MIADKYRKQVELLLRVLPYVNKEKDFALKGGTAINLFVRDLPRLSVDIDLTYLPFLDRKTDLAGITNGLLRIKESLESSIPDIQVQVMQQSDGNEAKLSCSLNQAQIKIEVNTVMRGLLQPTRMMQVTQKVQDDFGLFAGINVVSQGELYGGKICAALDRQHPRDLFDVRCLFENEGITEEIKLGFIGALIGHGRPMHEIIKPSFQDQRKAFENKFSGMTTQSFDYDDFEVTRKNLVKSINGVLTETDRGFLISFTAGDPDWGLYPFAVAKNMPGVKWKLLNIGKLKKSNSVKHKEQLDALKKILEL